MSIDFSLILQLVTLGGIVVSVTMFILKEDWSTKEQLIKITERVCTVEANVKKMMNNHLAHIADNIKEIKSQQVELDKKLYAHLKNHK